MSERAGRLAGYPAMDQRQMLAKADADIADAKQCIARQQGLIEKIARSGRDTRAAEELLATMHNTLHAMQAYRRTIVTELRV